MNRFSKAIAILLASIIMMPWLVLAETEGDSGDEESSIETEKYENGGQVGGYYMCPGYAVSYERDPDEDSPNEGGGNEEAAILATTLGEYESKLGSSSGSCGSPNGFTKTIEMSDCVRSGKVVTEISESFAGETKLGSGDNIEAEVMNIYKGTCCMVLEHIPTASSSSGDGGSSSEGGSLGSSGSSDTTTTNQQYECKEPRTVYFEDFSNCQNNALNCERRQWIIGSSGASIIKIYIKQIYMWAAGTIGFISVIIIVINGIRISVSGATGDITQSKERIIQSISGLVLLFLSGLLLYTINPVFFS